MEKRVQAESQLPTSFVPSEFHQFDTTPVVAAGKDINAFFDGKDISR